VALFGRLEGGKMCFGKHRLDDTKDLNVNQSSCLSNGTSDTRHTQFCVMNYLLVQKHCGKSTNIQQAQLYRTDANVSKQSKKKET